MKKVNTSLKGRVCKYRRCKNILSIYNHELYCHVHLDMIMREPQSKVVAKAR